MNRCAGWFGLLFLAGCAASPTAIEGTVTLDGKPLALASVTLVPEAHEAKPVMSISDGEGVFRPSMQGHGMVSGTYKVLVMVPQHPSAPVVPALYADPSRTPLRIKIPAAEPIQLRLSSEAK
jgi:hypothetical protein